MKNLAKKTIAIVAAGIMIVFSGCSNLLGGGDSSQNNEKKYTVSGSINLGCALPSSVADAMQSAESSARTATSSFSSASASAVWTVTAKQGEKSVTGSVYQVAGVYKYNLELPLSGEWLLHVKMTIGSSVILEGGASLFAVSGTSQVQDVLMSPVTSSETGSVNLTITDGTANSLIARVSSKAIQNLHTIDSHGGNSVNTGIKEFTNKKAAIVMNNVPAGRYEATLNFEDAAGNILYSCKEIFTVFAGFTTDIWTGESVYIKEGEFTVTDALIGGYGTELVTSTETYLYEKYKTEPTSNWYSGYDYKLPNSESITTDTTSYNLFCLDENGNIYVIKELVNKNLPYDNVQYNYRYCITSITSNTSNFGNGGNASFGAESISGIRGFASIQCDKVTKKFYGIVTYEDDNNNTYTNDFYEYPISAINETWAWESIEAGVEKHYSIEGISAEIESFTVHNGVLYVPYKDSSGFYLLIAELSKAVPDGNDNYIRVEDYGSLVLNLTGLSGDITDCIYQDGNVYFLIKDSSFDNPIKDIKSRGAVVRVNLFGNKTDYIGWTYNFLNKEETYLYALYPVDNNGVCTGHKFYYTEANSKGSRIIAKASDLYKKGQSPDDYRIGNIYCPAASGTNIVLYGPKKFIAIKPKKLIIADDGIALYTDAYGALCYKNANRVVTVDLESFAITESSDANVNFDGDGTGILIYDCSYGQATSSVFYNADTKEDIPTSTDLYQEGESEVDTSIECFSIPCMDN